MAFHYATIRETKRCHPEGSPTQHFRVGASCHVPRQFGLLPAIPDKPEASFQPAAA
jgi:hypothetical protein